MSLRLVRTLVLGNTRRHSIVSISRNFYSVAGFGKLEVLDQFDAIAKFYKVNFGRKQVSYQDHLEGFAFSAEQATQAKHGLPVRRLCILSRC